MIRKNLNTLRAEKHLLSIKLNQTKKLREEVLKKTNIIPIHIFLKLPVMIINYWTLAIWMEPVDNRIIYTIYTYTKCAKAKILFCSGISNSNSWKTGTHTHYNLYPFSILLYIIFSDFFMLYAPSKDEHFS